MGNERKVNDREEKSPKKVYVIYNQDAWCMESTMDGIDKIFAKYEDAVEYVKTYYERDAENYSYKYLREFMPLDEYCASVIHEFDVM